MNRLKRFLKRRRIKHLLIAAALLAAAFAVFIYFWIFHDLPDVGDIDQQQVLPATQIYDRNGELLYEILPAGQQQGRSRPLTLEEMPAHCVNAAIATEDANYYDHPGVDLIGVARALWLNLRGGEVIAGGSTITQQTARILLLDPDERAERTVRRKLREMVLALRLQGEYSKDEILALYLNQVYFGNLAYGLDGAAQIYFARSAQDLSLSQCALLIGLMQNPAAYNPLLNLDAARARQETVLDLMVRQGSISQRDADSALADPLQFASVPFPIRAPHAVMTIWAQLERDYPEALAAGGLIVETTIDADWTEAAQRVVQQQLDRINNPIPGERVPADANNAAVVALDPHTGAVRVMLGSPDYFDESIAGAVNVALMPRQPGSTLKPFTYAAAMAPANPEPYTPATMLLDVETSFVTQRDESYVPGNYANVEHGPVLVREALASSYNIPAVIALNHIGVDALVQLLADAGVENLMTNTTADLSITLGGGEVRLLDLVQAYSIFPNGGYRVDPVLISRISTVEGEVLYEWQPQPLEQRVIDERIAYLVTDILSDDDARVPSFGRNSWLQLGRPAAAKTGTTTDFRDNWVVGYTPDLVLGVWVGNADNSIMYNVTGLTGAGPIWHYTLRELLRGEPERDFQRPPGIVEMEICSLSGQLPTDACALRRSELFLREVTPTQPDDLYQTFIIDRRTGYLADASTPPEQAVERVYVVLPEEARAWGIANGITPPPADAPPQNNQPLRLISPDPFGIYQISPVLPISSQRIRLEAAGPADTVAVTLRLEKAGQGVVLEHTDSQAPYLTWWPLAIGQYTLTGTAIDTAGTLHTTEPMRFTVVTAETADPPGG